MDSTLTCLVCNAEVTRRRRPSFGQLIFCSARCRSKWRREQREANPADPPERKVCRDCGVEKPASDFYTHLLRADGLHPNCKECFLVHSGEYYKEHREESLTQRREQYARDPKYKQRQMMNARRYYYQNYERAREQRRERYQRTRDETLEYHRRRYAASKAWMAEVKSRYACVRCGENHPACLDFHHRDPALKVFNISEATMGPWTEEEVLAEIEKCTPYCSNCHRKMHYEERQGRANQSATLPLPLTGH